VGYLQEGLMVRCQLWEMRSRVISHVFRLMLLLPILYVFLVTYSFLLSQDSLNLRYTVVIAGFGHLQTYQNFEVSLMITSDKVDK
jgi:hypothetical protein